MSGGRIVRSGPPDRVLEDKKLVETVLESRARLKSTGSQGGGGGGGGATTVGGDQLVEEEQKMEGVVDARVYWTYLSYTGSAVGVFLVAATLFMYVLQSSQDVWMTHWLRQVQGDDGNASSRCNSSTAETITTTTSMMMMMTSKSKRTTTTLTALAEVNGGRNQTSDDLTFYLG